LQSSGQAIVSTPQSARESHRAEAAVVDKSLPRNQREPQTARALLEENKQLVVRKQEERTMARKKSRDRIEQLLQGDQKVIEADKAKHASRRLAQQELSRYYKTRIAEKELEKANEYRSKLDGGEGEDHYFPYTEGEHINKTRKAQNDLMREEMRGFLKEQRDIKGASSRKINGDENLDDPYLASGMFGTPLQEALPPGSSGGPKQPKFLTRPVEHMSRRIQDEHVRRALEDKVQRTKDELEERNRRRQKEAQTFEDGMMVNDALRYDATFAKSRERGKNADYLKAQIEERRIKDETDARARKSESAGYWGPEEKECPGMTDQLMHSTDLIRQMEVNQARRIDSRSRRLKQERRIVDNSLAEIHQDRELERQKVQVHREVLVTTWNSQKKIREVLDRIEKQVG